VLSLLKAGDKLRNCRILLRIVAFVPPDDEVGGLGGDRRQHERGGEDDGPNLHGAAP
jgi:hypothetical protein